MFIEIEGMDGSGKTTLLNSLKEKRRDICFTREPGGTEFAEKMRDFILENEMDPYTEAHLFALARRNHGIEKISPALEQGKIVVSDRYITSSYVYQGAVKGLGFDTVNKINKEHQVLFPDYTIYLDLEPEKAMKRIFQGNRETNRFDEEDLIFFKKVRNAYLELARLSPEKFFVVSADCSKEELLEKVESLICELKTSM